MKHTTKTYRSALGFPGLRHRVLSDLRGHCYTLYTLSDLVRKRTKDWGGTGVKWRPEGDENASPCVALASDHLHVVISVPRPLFPVDVRACGLINYNYTESLTPVVFES
jgi:hypothetical protein